MALLREGRSFEMLTGGEHWRWTRRMDEAFGVRVLTVEVSERASAAALLVDDDDALDAKPPLAHAHDDTIMLVEAMKTFNQNFRCVAVPDIANDSAHMLKILSLFGFRHKCEGFDNKLVAIELAGNCCF